MYLATKAYIVLPNRTYRFIHKKRELTHFKILYDRKMVGYAIKTITI
jgi:hypothetical protein